MGLGESGGPLVRPTCVAVFVEAVDGAPAARENVRIPLSLASVRDVVGPGVGVARRPFQVRMLGGLPCHHDLSADNPFPIAPVLPDGIEAAAFVQEVFSIVQVVIIVLAVVPIAGSLDFEKACTLLGVAVFPHHREAGLLVGGFAHTTSCAAVVVPIAGVAHLLVLGRIGQSGVHAQAEAVREGVGEAAQAVVVVRGAAEVHIAGPDAVVFAAQDDVDDLLAHTIVDAGDFGLVGHALVGFDVLHNVGGDLLECRLCVAAYEVGAVDQQAVHLLAAIVEHAVAQFQSGQLPEDFTQHFALGGGHGVEVVDHCVFFGNEEQARAPHGGLAQLVAGGVGRLLCGERQGNQCEQQADQSCFHGRFFPVRSHIFGPG